MIDKTKAERFEDLFVRTLEAFLMLASVLYKLAKSETLPAAQQSSTTSSRVL